MYWKDGKGANPGSWHGPARVLMVERYNLVWISHMTKLFRCAPEHARPLSKMRRALSLAKTKVFNFPNAVGMGRSSLENCPPKRAQPQ